jgi:hypothetical protein
MPVVQEGRYARLVHMITLTETRAITPYVRVNTR